MSNNTNIVVFRILQVIAWLIFIGFSIEACGYLVNFFFSLYRPDIVNRLYQKLDLSDLYQKSRLAYFLLYCFILSITFLKAHLFYRVILMIQRLDLKNPFNEVVSTQILRISYFTLAIGFLCVIAEKIEEYLSRRELVNLHLTELWNDGDSYLVMGAVIYIIAIIFKKGVTLQTENDLTV